MTPYVTYIDEQTISFNKIYRFQGIISYRNVSWSHCVTYLKVGLTAIVQL